MAAGVYLSGQSREQRPEPGPRWSGVKRGAGHHGVQALPERQVCEAIMRKLLLFTKPALLYVTEDGVKCGWQRGNSDVHQTVTRTFVSIKNKSTRERANTKKNRFVSACAD